MTTPTQHTDLSIALVTGANKGIGFEAARLLAERGMTVLLGTRDEGRGKAAADELAGRGLDVAFLPLDVTDDNSIAVAATTVATTYGQLDVLVNNAGIAGEAFIAPSATSRETARAVFETNVFGVVAVTNAFLPLLRQAPAARIVNVSSEIGALTSVLDQHGPLWPFVSAAYPSSKAALNMVTAMYAKELWSTPIKVNAANPGYCATDLNGHTGFRSADQGAVPIVALATLPADGPTGVLYGHLWRTDAGNAGNSEYGVLAW